MALNDLENLANGAAWGFQMSRGRHSLTAYVAHKQADFYDNYHHNHRSTDWTL